MMNRGNAALNSAVLRELELAGTDRVLEIGFGGGVALASLVGAADFVGGVDRSKDMVQRARSRFADAVAQGRADFREGSVEAIPFGDASFGKVCTANTVYFWRSLDEGFSEIRRVLSPGGRAVVGFVPKDRMDRMGVPADIFMPRTPEEIVSSMNRTGFRDVQTVRAPTSASRVVAVGIRG